MVVGEGSVCFISWKRKELLVGVGKEGMVGSESLVWEEKVHICILVLF